MNKSTKNIFFMKSETKNTHKSISFFLHGNKDRIDVANITVDGWYVVED